MSVNPVLLLTAMCVTALAVELDHTKWVLKEAPPKVTLPAHAKWHVLFDKGRVSWKACNSHSGSYRVAGDRLVVGRMISTMMACLPDATEPEKALLAMASDKPQYRIDGTTLTLTATAGGAWKFSREPLPSPRAVTKFIYVAAEKKPCTAGIMETTCLQIRESKDQPWRLNYIPIVGFEHHPGVEYRLRINEEKITNPPADASRVAWYLDMIVEQKVVKPASR